MSGWTELADKLERAEAEITALTAAFEAMENELSKDDEYWRAHGAIANIAESFTGRWT